MAVPAVDLFLDGKEGADRATARALSVHDQEADRVQEMGVEPQVVSITPGPTGPRQSVRLVSQVCRYPRLSGRRSDW